MFIKQVLNYNKNNKFVIIWLYSVGIIIVEELGTVKTFTKIKYSI